MKYVCNSVAITESCGGYSIYFPEVEGAITQGETLSEAVMMTMMKAMTLKFPKNWHGKFTNRLE